jgi:queuine tRNA-ribosyltransferase
MVLANAYHLYLRPGDHMVRALGGLHAFTRWTGPMLTDSGGFQVFSLSRYRTVREEGVEFRSKLDGSLHQYTPEKRDAHRAQPRRRRDHAARRADRGRLRPRAVARAMERSLRWLERCREEFDRLTREGRAPVPVDRAPPGGRAAARHCTTWSATLAPPQALFPIVQGGTTPSCARPRSRASCSGRLARHRRGRPVGGRGQGGDVRTFDTCDPAVAARQAPLPHGRRLPRRPAGGRAPRRGPLRLRGPDAHGTARHRLHPRRQGAGPKSSFRTDRRPLVEGCPCPACTHYDRAYLRHLIVPKSRWGRGCWRCTTWPSYWS